MSTVARLGGELLGGAGLGEVGGQRRGGRSPGSSAASASSASALAGAEDQRRAALGQRLGDRPAEAAGGAGEQCCAAGKFHPRAQATSRDCRQEFGMQVRKATKCLCFVSKRAGRSSTLPPFRITETPNPARQRRRGNGGTTFSGLTHLAQAGAQAPFSASPTANPVGRRRRSVCFRTTSKFKAGLALSAALVVARPRRPGGASAGCDRRRRHPGRSRHLHPDRRRRGCSTTGC